jgi:hypothetical protein
VAAQQQEERERSGKRRRCAKRQIQQPTREREGRGKRQWHVKGRGVGGWEAAAKTSSLDIFYSLPVHSSSLGSMSVTLPRELAGEE